MIKDFYDNWSIEKTCDTVKLESSLPSQSLTNMFYTYECKDDEIVYFKVDANLINIGNVSEAMSKRLDLDSTM